MTDRNLLTALLLSTALITGACNKKDADTAARSVAEVADLSVKSVDARTIEKMLAVKDRSVSSADAETALKKMGLMNKSTGLSWADKSGKNGSYSYKDVNVKTKDGETINIATLDLTGVHMVDDQPTFDRMDAKGVTLDADDATLKINRLSLARPSPKLGGGIMKSLEAIEDLRDLDDVDIDMDFEDGEMAFGALLMDGLNVKGDDVDMTLNSIGWGENETSGKAVFLLDDLNITGRDKKNDFPVNISVGSISGSGLDMNYFRSNGFQGMGEDIISRSRSFGKNGPGFNPYAKTFDNFALKDFNLNADTLSISTDGASGTATRKNDITTIKQSLSPVIIRFTGESSDREIREMQDGLAKFGFDELQFSASQTSILDEKNDTFSVTDAMVDLKDGFNLTYDYKGRGLKALQQNNAKGGKPDLDAILEDMELESMNMTLTDYDLVDKAFKFAAEQQGTSAALMRMQAKGALMVLSLGAQNEEQGKALSAIGTAVGEFIDEGGTLKIGLNPPAPVSIGQFQDIRPETINPNDLGFTIEHVK